MIFFPSLIQRHPKWGRWLYAGVSSLGAAGFTFAFIYKVAGTELSSNDRSYELLFPVIAAAFLAGLICWPKKNRGLGRMILAGLLTVAMSFLLFGLMLFGLAAIRGKVGLDDIFTSIPMAFFMLLMGSILTLGSPYVIGICLSFLFIDIDE